MKTMRLYIIPQTVSRSAHWVLLVVCTLIWGNNPVTAQDSTAVTEEAPVYKSKTSLTATQMDDGSIELSALLRAKGEESYVAVPDAKVMFYFLNAEGEEESLGDQKTGVQGKAVLTVVSKDIPADADGYFSLLARYEGNDNIKASESDVRIRPAMLKAEPVEEDSTYLIRFQATTNGADGAVPIADAAVNVYVKRMFYPLKVGEGTTDESGNVEIEFPNDLPGDQDANLFITAMIEETDEYGNLAVSFSKPWGYAVKPGSQDLPRALWSPIPPTWMIVTFFILMGTVWGNYGIIIFKLFRVRFRQEGSHHH